MIGVVHGEKIERWETCPIANGISERSASRTRMEPDADALMPAPTPFVVTCCGRSTYTCMHVTTTSYGSGRTFAW